VKIPAKGSLKIHLLKKMIKVKENHPKQEKETRKIIKRENHQFRKIKKK
jgi:hypothetical protein